MNSFQEAWAEEQGIPKEEQKKGTQRTWTTYEKLKLARKVSKAEGNRTETKASEYQRGFRCLTGRAGCRRTQSYALGGCLWIQPGSSFRHMASDRAGLIVSAGLIISPAVLVALVAGEPDHEEEDPGRDAGGASFLR